MSSDILLVNALDQEMGYADKTEVHIKGLLHRAFSVFVLNNKHELLLQRRALGKYHSPGLWTNTCCSHAFRGETLEQSTHRRLMEEMGFDCSLNELFSFTYRVELDHNMIEYEIDHVFAGYYNEVPNPNPDEVGAWKYISLQELKTDLENNPQDYTYWLKVAFNRFYENVKNIGV